jgi:hypothetical protein
MTRPDSPFSNEETMQRAVIFGCGERGQQACVSISAHTTVVGFVDNDPERQRTIILDRKVFAPSDLAALNIDVIYIASSHVQAIRRQLAEQFGIAPDRVRVVPGIMDADEDAPVDAEGDHTLGAYLNQGYHQIAGWLLPAAVDTTLLLAEIQQTAFPAGPVAEIGVWEGRYLTLLSFLPHTPQRVVGIDPFIHGGDRAAQLTRVRANIARFARRPSLATLIERDSKTVTAGELLAASGGPCQFFSVDGDHTLEGALHDLRLAEAVTAPGGIVALDDIPNFSCPGVTEAVVRYGAEADSSLAPFLLVSNKLFLTQREHCAFYRERLLAHLSDGRGGEWGRRVVEHRNRMGRMQVPVRFLGEELLVAA